MLLEAISIIAVLASASLVERIFPKKTIRDPGRGPERREALLII